MNLLWLDTETAGLDERRHSLLEVGMVAVRDGEVVGEYGTFIRSDVYHIDPEAMLYNGLDIQQVQAEGKNPNLVVREVWEFVISAFREEIPILAGHNLFLDRRMMNKLFADAGADFTALHSHRTLDTMSLLYLLHSLGAIPESALGVVKACRYFGIGAVPHRAVDDARLTWELYQKVLSLFPQLPFIERAA